MAKNLGPDTQAGRIIRKAGGFDRLSKLIFEATGVHRDRTAIYRWNVPKSRGGTGGVIPYPALKLVEAAFRYDGLLLTTEDLFPGNRPDIDVVS